VKIGRLGMRPAHHYATRRLELLRENFHCLNCRAELCISLHISSEPLARGPLESCDLLAQGRRGNVALIRHFLACKSFRLKLRPHRRLGLQRTRQLFACLLELGHQRLPLTSEFAAKSIRLRLLPRYCLSFGHGCLVLRSC
jgi:hypothetical protein